MRPIPTKDKRHLAELRQVCAKCRATPVQWHHPFTYAGKQITDWWATVFACKNCHERATPHNMKFNREFQEFFEWQVLKNYLIQLCLKYPKRDWIQWHHYLRQKYEVSL